MSPQEVVSRINTSCSGSVDSFNIKAILASWTPYGNLIIEFLKSSSAKNITNASQTICQILAPGDTGTIFAKVVNLSKIVFPQVPCKAWSQGGFVNGDGEPMITDQGFHSAGALFEEVRNAHPSMEKAVFIHEPSWTVAELTPEAELANLAFTVEDPDGSIVSTLERATVAMFGKHVSPKAWKEKIDLQQCNRCWQLCRPHPGCPVKCRKCGSTKHLTELHNLGCEGCKATGRPKTELESKQWKCTHIRCINCGGSHEADFNHCQAWDKEINTARQRKRGMNFNGQTILDPNTITNPPQSHQGNNRRQAPPFNVIRRPRME
jgi:hypothetical protein